MNYKKIVVAATTAGFILSGTGLAYAQANTWLGSAWNSGASAVGSTLELHINNNGSVLARGAKITSIGTSTIAASQTFGSTTINWTVRTDDAQLILRYGGQASLADFSVGDYISFTGSVDTSGAGLTVNATAVRDYSSQRAHATFIGTVSSVNTTNSSFVLSTNRGDITVFASSSALKMGDATTSFSSIVVGGRVKAEGVWNTLTNELQASSIMLSQNTALLQRRTFQGTLGTLSGSTSPATFTFSSGGSNYTVKVASNTLLLSNSWNPITLSQLASGNIVRVYGAVESSNLSTIDALIVRDTSIQ